MRASFGDNATRAEPTIGSGHRRRSYLDSLKRFDLEVVAHCRAQGLAAFQHDFLHLDLGRQFDAAFAMNCLLHVPREDLPAVLSSVRSTLVPGGLFYLGQYGGIDHEGAFADDTYEPQRYFSLLTDEDLFAVARTHFEIESFQGVEIPSDDGDHFQSMVLRA